MGLVPALEPGWDISIQSNTSSSARWREVRQLRSSSLGTIADIYNHVVRCSCSWHCLVCAVWCVVTGASNQSTCLHILMSYT